jgi:hypothetical protein
VKRDSSHILLGYFNIPLSAFRRSLIWSRLTHQGIRLLSVYLDHISRTSPPPALSIDLTLSYFPQIPTTPSYLGNRLVHLDTLDKSHLSIEQPAISSTLVWIREPGVQNTFARDSVPLLLLLVSLLTWVHSHLMAGCFNAHTDLISLCP